jgi:hypothetical protein
MTMRRFRFSIASLLGVVLFAAVAVAAFRLANDAWDSAVFATTVLCLLLAVLLTVHHSELERAYWLGFVLFGASYLAASLIPSIEVRLPSSRLLALRDSTSPVTGMPGIAAADYNNDGALDLLVTGHTFLGEVLLNNGNGTFRTVKSTPLVSAGASEITPGTLVERLIAATRPLAGAGGTTENQARIMHSILAVVLGFAGGHLSCALYAKGRIPASKPRECAAASDRDLVVAAPVTTSAAS